ncbi:MAG: BACON domain-containing protein [Muribaculaceae bacterium]|nr:BACON domain-containing protein [Muribaculaceae bacterium]
MKKIYLFLSAACVAVSASAVQKEMAVCTSQPLKTQPMQAVKSDAGVGIAKAVVSSEAASKVNTRAGESPVLCMRPADNVMSFGMSPAGGFYQFVGFASSYGYVDFLNYSTGISSYEWLYSDLNDYVIVDNRPVFNEKTANTTDLRIKSGVGFFPAPVLYGTPEAGGNEMVAQTYLSAIYCGGGADYWMNGSEEISDEEALGVTFYQNTGLTSGRSNGSTCYPNAYRPNAQGFGANGLCNNGNDAWESTLESAWFRDMDVTDIKMNNYTIIQPKPVSTYTMTRGWIWMQVEAKSATMLVSNIYPIDEEGVVSEMPIAIGYASIPAGGTDTPIFYYSALDEEGDEIEDAVYINSAVAITIEGFVGNDAITSVIPVSGYYPFNYSDYVAGNYDVCKDGDLYLNLDVTADGQLYKDCLVYNLGLYGFGDSSDVLTSLTYAQFNMDATFAWIHSVDDVYEVNIPAEGGKVETNVEALYYNIKLGIDQGWYVLEAPEWLTVEVSEFDQATGETTLTVSADAFAEGRTGVVTIEGMGATYALTVNQGEGNAVNSISIDKNAQYFDLQGRRVANPDKGIYIKKTANKSEKVIL